MLVSRFNFSKIKSDFNTLAMSFIPASARSPEDRLNDINSILNWIRSGSKPDDDSISDEVRRINQMLPVKKGQSPESRARDIESALDWMVNPALRCETTYREGIRKTAWKQEFPQFLP